MKRLLFLTALTMLTISMSGCSGWGCGGGLFGHRLFHHDSCPCETASPCDSCCAAADSPAIGEDMIVQPPTTIIPTPAR